MEIRITLSCWKEGRNGTVCSGRCLNWVLADEKRRCVRFRRRTRESVKERIASEKIVKIKAHR